MERTNIDSNNDYTRALVRADAKGYMVSAIIKNRKHNEVIGCVVTGPDSKHNVIVDEQFLLCDCPAADHSVVCVHVAVTQRKLMERAAQAAQVRACGACGASGATQRCPGGCDQNLCDACYIDHCVSGCNAALVPAQETEQEADRLAIESATGQDVFDTEAHVWHAFSSVDALFDTLATKDVATTEPIMIRHDTGPRLYR